MHIWGFVGSIWIILRFFFFFPSSGSPTPNDPESVIVASKKESESLLSGVKAAMKDHHEFIMYNYFNIINL